MVVEMEYPVPKSQWIVSDNDPPIQCRMKSLRPCLEIRQSDADNIYTKYVLA
jgi:hypothetical protein